MPKTWQTDEVIRCLAETDQEELRELVEEAGDDAVEELKEWVREGNGPKSMYDAVMRFTANSNRAFDLVDWETVIHALLSSE